MTEKTNGREVKFSLQGRVGGVDVQLQVLVPPDDPRAARVFFPAGDGRPAACLSVEDVFGYADRDPTEEVRQLAVECLRRLRRFCEERKWPDAGMYYLRGLIPRLPAGEEKASLLLALGRTLEGKRDLVGAVAAYWQAVDLKPADVALRYAALLNLGRSLNRMGFHAEAEAPCREAVHADPEQPDAYQHLGEALEGQRKPLDAACCYVRAAERSPGTREIIDRLRRLLDTHVLVFSSHPEFEEALLRFDPPLPAASAS